MTVEEHRLHFREQRIAAVQMSPARLDHSDLRVGKEVDRLLQEIARRNKVSVENANEVTFRRREARLERAGLEADPIDAMNALHIEAALAQLIGGPRDRALA